MRHRRRQRPCPRCTSRAAGSAPQGADPATPPRRPAVSPRSSAAGPGRRTAQRSREEVARPAESVAHTNHREVPGEVRHRQQRDQVLSASGRAADGRNPPEQHLADDARPTATALNASCAASGVLRPVMRIIATPSSPRRTVSAPTGRVVRRKTMSNNPAMSPESRNIPRRPAKHPIAGRPVAGGAEEV